MAEPTGADGSMEPNAMGNTPTVGGSYGPTWRGWALSILVAIILSVAATLLLGGSTAFRTDGAIGPATGRSGHGVEGGCCPPAGIGK